jgi:hypothetical protein
MLSLARLSRFLGLCWIGGRKVRMGDRGRLGLGCLGGKDGEYIQ